MRRAPGFCSSRLSTFDDTDKSRVDASAAEAPDLERRVASRVQD